MSQLVVNGNNISLTANGRLANLADWSPDLAEAIAKDEGLVLTDAHWDTINLMRDYYATYNIPQIGRASCRERV